LTTCKYYAPSEEYANNPTDGIHALGPLDNYCASLGRGGEIILDMGENAILTDYINNNDFIIYEGDEIEDGYSVYVSDGWNGPWTFVDDGLGTTEFDLEGIEVVDPRFVRIVDDGDGSASEEKPGCDIDCVQKLPNLINDPPMAMDDYVSVLINSSHVIHVLANDVDIDGSIDSTTVTITGVGPTNGNLTVDPVNGDVNYTPDLGYIGLDSFTYTVSDDLGAISNEATVHIIIDEIILIVNQSVFDRGFPIRHALDGDWAAAQSFIPTLNTLTNAEIYLRKFGTPEFNLTVELREDNPQGTLIDTLIFTPEETPSSWEWFPLDFTDTTVTPGTDYFIVCPPAPSGVTTSFGYEWGYAFGNQYDDGAFWFTRDGGGLWRDLPTMYEFAFRTYGYD